jgi:acyl-ACP thioesterase
MEAVPPMVPEPATGRVYAAERRVRLGDVTPRGRLRFDALARYLQDVATDDANDAGLDDAMAWVVRRTVFCVTAFPTFSEWLVLRTWCGAIGSRWAERRTSVAGDDGGRVESATLWIHLDTATLRPKPLPSRFHELYGAAAGGRTVRARLLHGDPSDGAGTERRPWALRFTDFDVLGHVNNAAYWHAVEEELARRRDLRAPLRAELEHRGAFDVGATRADVVVRDEARRIALWMRNGAGAVMTSVIVQSPDAT